MPDQVHTAAAYEIVLAPRGKPAQTLPLDNFDGNNNDFLRFFASFIKSMPASYLIHDGNRSYGEPKNIMMAGCTYACRLVSGIKGIRSQFRARGTNPLYKRTAEDIEEMDFGVYLLRPPNAKVGFLVLEHIGDRSIARAFRTKLTEHFKTVYPDIRMTLSRTAHTDAWRKAEEQGDAISVKQLTIVHRHVDSSQYAQFGIGGITTKLGEYRRVLRFTHEPESASFLTKARNYFYPPAPAIPAAGGLLGMTTDDDGGADELEHDAANELIAEVRYPGQPPQSIRCSGARPPAIKYDVYVGPESEDTDSAFLTRAKAIAKSLADAGGCLLETGWDSAEWQDADSLPSWEVQGFGQATATPEQPAE